MTRTTQKALQNAIKKKYGYIITLSQQQFYSESLDRVLDVTDICLTVPKWTIDTKGRRNRTQRKIKLFSAGNRVQTCLFLRDVLYYLDKKEIPTNNQKWEDIKASRRTYRVEVDKIYQEEAEE